MVGDVLNWAQLIIVVGELLLSSMGRALFSLYDVNLQTLVELMSFLQILECPSRSIF